MPKSPLFGAEHADRYERQQLIRDYEQAYECRLVVMRDVIFERSVPFLEELLWDAERDSPLHLMLDSPGGDGETAVRLVRSAQERCSELTVIVPNQAKSAATLLLLGAHSILMGPTSDLGPVDPQFQIGEGPLVAAKDIIAAVEAAEVAIAANPDSFPLHAALLADVSAIMVQQARSAIARSADLVREALSSCPKRQKRKVAALVSSLTAPLIEAPNNHGAVFGADDAIKAGLPVTKLDPHSDHWQTIWRLYARYYVLRRAIYEGRIASRSPQAE